MLLHIAERLGFTRRALLRLIPATVLTPLPAWARADRPEGEPANSLAVGDRPVSIRAHRSGKPGHFYLNLHENESTAIAAAIGTVDRFGGEFYWLRAEGSRLISFRLRGRRYRFDPNRMFSDVGVEKNLHLLGAYSPEAATEVRRFAMLFAGRLALRSRPLIVAVHNNARGGSFSISSYQRGGPEHLDAASVSLNSNRDRDDFFLVTDARLYDYLRMRGHNVVLQANERVRDNGSLSIWAARNRVTYINVEAQYGHLAEQTEMLADLQGWTT